MKKETFVALINGVLEQEKNNKAFAEAIEPFLNSYFILKDSFQDLVVQVLENEMGDNAVEEHERIISWWLWDAPDAGKNINSSCVQLASGEKILLHTAEQLYYYLKNRGK